ncbi:hypothetical protein SPBRAN_1684 [uncultured Candidatus Thioglobus sp.]|nr:hypothetical protein SPBRAN_1684 [uncultured Candidatus Thioglobus sp.]
MEFEYDKNKSNANKQKYSISFVEAQLLWSDKSVSKALVLKKALGHYAVVWDAEKQQVKRIEAKDLPEYAYKDCDSKDI